MPAGTAADGLSSGPPFAAFRGDDVRTGEALGPAEREGESESEGPVEGDASPPAEGDEPDGVPDATATPARLPPAPITPAPDDGDQMP
ncbi:hypothetical protein [Streptomyces mangrovisoli]|uniref:hypothetical protein n=1 Tax=Streptomyces mangrovisoli TaxID=1428628 RepID=UPI00116076F1|nr:hypothetical protein [Streptomyces mangrovisoli]